MLVTLTILLPLLTYQPPLEGWVKSPCDWSCKFETPLLWCDISKINN